MEDKMIEVENDVNSKGIDAQNDSQIMSGIECLEEKKAIDMNISSGEHQNQIESSYSTIKDIDKSHDKSKAKIGKQKLNAGYSDDSWSNRTNETSNVNESTSNDKKGENFSQIAYDNYYANYYQHCGVKSIYPETDRPHSRGKDSDSKPRPMDLINKALAKQEQNRDDNNRDDNKRSTPLEAAKTDEDVEEGQIPSSPRAVSKGYSSSSTPSKASSPSTPFDSSTRNSQYDSSKSMSRSVSKERLIKSRSRSRSRRRYLSRSRSRSLSRQRRRRSRSRSPYLGPIIKDYRRGRRGFVRYPRGFRDRGMNRFRRGHHSQHHYFPHGFSRRPEFSRSRSRSFSPKRRQIDAEKSDVNSDEEKQFDSKLSETLKPSDINMSQKRITQSFLAMLEEKQNRSKMVPIESNRSCETSEGDDNFNKQHGFVNTFNTVREMDARKHTLSYDLEREGWQVIDDANSESAPKRHLKNREEDRYDDKFKDLEHSYEINERQLFDIQEKMPVLKEIEGDSSSSDEINKKKKKKKKTKKRKKKRKRKTSTSSDSSDSESDNENADDLLNINKKKAKKKKKSSKKKKKVVSSSSSSENDDKEEKQKKKKKRKKKKDSSSDSESEDKVEETLSLASSQKLVTEGSDIIGMPLIPTEIVRDGTKIKDKKKKKRKADTSDSSDSDSDENEKKKKKKNKKKKSRKRKHRSSSSSSSTESSDSSESGDRKKKKKKKSKKNKKSRKHKKEKKSEKKEKNKLSNDEKKKSKHDEESKQSEFVTVFSIGDPPLELKWPKKLIKYTITEPSLQYSINPKVSIIEEDFRNNKEERYKINEEILRKRKFVEEFGSDNDIDINQFNKDDCNEKLASEYERFIDELNPLSESSHEISEQSLALESKMRESLLKQFHRTDSEEQYLVTPSEKRAIERFKKQHQQTLDDNQDNRRYDDFKSVPLSTYYSAKKQHKSSPPHKSEDLEKPISVKSSSKSSESEPFHRLNDISLSISDRKHESQTSENFTKSDDKKKTARELLERVKQKKHSGKESESKDDSHNNKRIPQIGKMKKPPKKSLLKSSRTPSITTANADSTQNTFVSQPMKLDMNYDYNWYYKYYMDSYALGQYSTANNSSLAAAYYAQYAMLTSFDYKQSDLSNWVQQRGYTYDNNYLVPPNEQNLQSNQQLINSNDIINPLKTEENPLESNNVESSGSELISANLSLVDSEAVKHEVEVNDLTESIPKAETVEKTSQNDIVSEETSNALAKVLTTENSHNGQQNIEVVVSALHSGISLDQLNNTETKNEGESSPNMSPFSSAKFKHKVKVRVTTSSQNDLESEDCVSPPPPPPPPQRPQMTTITSTEPITLPNGQVLPSGTKQIVVHPYQSPDSFKFNADWFYNAFNAQNSTTPPTNASETQSVVKV